MSRLTTQERARRQKIMMSLRAWMEQQGVSRQEVADALGITRGHLSTLINANRTATNDQCLKALALVDGGFIPGAGEIKVAKAKKRTRPPAKKKQQPRSEPKKTPKPNKLRPLTKFEAAFVQSVAKSWIQENKGASADELVDVVRALANGIRT